MKTEFSKSARPISKKIIKRLLYKQILEATDYNRVSSPEMYLPEWKIAFEEFIRDGIVIEVKRPWGITWICASPEEIVKNRLNVKTG
jgi:hypothetical protein